jgi:hypothetical protein
MRRMHKVIARTLKRLAPFLASPVKVSATCIVIVKKSSEPSASFVTLTLSQAQTATTARTVSEAFEKLIFQEGIFRASYEDGPTCSGA